MLGNKKVGSDELALGYYYGYSITISLLSGFFQFQI